MDEWNSDLASAALLSEGKQGWTRRPGLLCFRQDGAHDASIAAQLIPLIDAESDLCTGGGAHLPSSLVEGSNDHCEEHLLILRVSQVFGK